MLRTAVCFLLAVFQLLILHGCAPAPLNAEEILFSFSCSAECKSGDVSTVCLLDRPGLEMLRCTVQKPETLAGMEFHWDGHSFLMSDSGLCAKSEVCPLPKNHFAVILKEVLDYASRRDVLTPGEGDTFTGEWEDNPFTLYINRENGRIESISMPQKNFSVRFYEYTGINGNPVS